MSRYKNRVESFIREYGLEALRNTLAAIVPAVFIAVHWHLDFAIPFVIGTLNASMTDFPGQKREKMVVGIWGLFFSVFTCLVVGYSLPYIGVLLILISFLAGCYTLFAAAGQRLAMVGVTSLFLITFMMGLKPDNVLSFASFVGIGTVWFYVVTLLHHILAPYWELRKVLSAGYANTARILCIKSKCYDPDVSLESIYRPLANVSIKLAEQQETIRDLLLRDRRRSTDEGEYRLWLKAYVLMDLYGIATAIDHDYRWIRQHLTPLGVLPLIRRLIALSAEAVEVFSPHDKREQHRSYSIIQREMLAVLQELESREKMQNREVQEILQGTINNGYAFLQSLDTLSSNSGDDLIGQFYTQHIDSSAFLSPLSQGIRGVAVHIRTRSPLFIFAIRMSLLFLFGGIAGAILSDMKYTYWILMTIIVVARPTFAITQQRNIHRIGGTVAGLLLGGLLVYAISDVYVLLGFVVVFLFNFLLFNKRFYMVSVLFITASVVTALHLHQDDWSEVSISRLLFTLLGCTLAIVGWFVLPVKHEKGIVSLAKRAIDENERYLDVVRQYLTGQGDKKRYDMRLMRKNAFLALTKFSDAVFQMQKEPSKNAVLKEEAFNLYTELFYLQSMISGACMVRDQNTFQISEDGNRQDNAVRIDRITSLFAVLKQKNSFSGKNMV